MQEKIKEMQEKIKEMYEIERKTENEFSVGVMLDYDSDDYGITQMNIENVCYNLKENFISNYDDEIIEYLTEDCELNIDSKNNDIEKILNLGYEEIHTMYYEFCESEPYLPYLVNKNDWCETLEENCLYEDEVNSERYEDEQHRYVKLYEDVININFYEVYEELENKLIQKYGNE